MKLSVKTAVLIPVLVLAAAGSCLAAMSGSHDTAPVETKIMAREEPPAVVSDEIHAHPVTERCECEMGITSSGELIAPPDVTPEKEQEKNPAKRNPVSIPVYTPAETNPPSGGSEYPPSAEDVVTPPILPPIEQGEEIDPVQPDTGGSNYCPPLPDVEKTDTSIEVDEPIHREPPASTTQPETTLLPNNAADSGADLEN